jgi:hypothetical protein
MKKYSEIRFKPLFLTLLMVVMMAAPITTMAAQPTVNLGTTSTFAVLAGSTITNTGTTSISGSAGGNVDGNVGGDVGLFPGTAFDGKASVTITNGALHITDAIAIKAKDDLVTAYNDAAGRTPVTIIPSELGGTTLKPGTYASTDGTFGITGTLTLDAEGDPNGVFVFQMASTLTTASASKINLINSARFCRTFWQVGSSATLGTNSTFVGHILAMQSITATTGAVIQGQLLARNGAVTLDNNTIINGFCDISTVTPPVVVPPVVTTARLHVIKHVINDNGGKAVAANFKLHVKTLGKDISQSPAPGVESPGTSYTLAAGTYAISEDAFTGYTASYSGDSDVRGNITLAPGDNKTITITNNDNAVTPPIIPAPATIRVIKHVINDNGGKAVAANFKLHVKTLGKDISKSPAPGVESPGTTYTLAAGTYTISEDAFTGYTASYSGDSDVRGNITLAPGDNKTITITNNDIAIIPIISDNGGGTIPVVTTPEVLEGNVVTTTITGGQLPKTSTHLYEILLLGTILTLCGAIGLKTRKRYE